MKNILLLTSRRPRRPDALSILHNVCETAGLRAQEDVTIKSIPDGNQSPNYTLQQLKESDIIVADISGSRHDVLYRLGMSYALNRPTILVSDESGRPRLQEFNELYLHLYPKTGNTTAFQELVTKDIVRALATPDLFVLGQAPSEAEAEHQPTVFVSYSRADKECLERLRIHLKPLQREGAIRYWDDGEIASGQKWKEEIETALSDATIAVLLVSADFLASDFVVENELPKLLQAAEHLGTTILPIILKPCGIERHQGLSPFEVVNDPKIPLLGLPLVEQEAIYAEVAERIANELQRR